MSTDPFHGLDPSQTVKVLPRYLAGPGPVDLHSIWPLPFDKDWTLHQSQQGPAQAVSPCLRLFASYEPKLETRERGTWTITANRVAFGSPAWQVTFDAMTPTEVLRDAHTRLLDLYQADPPHDHRWLHGDAKPYEAYGQLLANGWRHTVKREGTQVFGSPDGFGKVMHRWDTTGPDGPAWRAMAGHPIEPLWRAQFSPGAPTALAAALTASLLSTEPVTRRVQDIPCHTRQHLHFVHATSPTPQAPRLSSVAKPPPSPASGRTR